ANCLKHLSPQSVKNEVKLTASERRSTSRINGISQDHLFTIISVARIHIYILKASKSTPGVRLRTWTKMTAKHWQHEVRCSFEPSVPVPHTPGTR
ncbi:unnamed protein product, partial [Ascophyllum nodosum]